MIYFNEFLPLNINLALLVFILGLNVTFSILSGIIFGANEKYYPQGLGYQNLGYL